jgi:DNA-directed RNA polymerase subunit RPC12/RpoP
MENSIFTLIGRFQYSSEAIIYQGKLESEGIEVFMRDAAIVDANPLYSNAVGGIKMYVKNDDAEAAKKSIAQISAFSLDDNNQLIKCPNCGAKKIEMMTSIKDIKSLLAFVFSALISIYPFHTKHKYKCQSCKFEFN